jgi:thioredoxin reductase (NADPH)
MEEAIFLARFADKVTLAHRRGTFRASQIMLERARAVATIDFLTPYTIDAFEVGGGPMQRIARLTNVETEAKLELTIAAAFVAVGHEPQSQLVAGQIELDARGYVVTEAKSPRTALPGVFAAGDLVDHTYRQAVTAAGSGCQAALEAEWYLRDLALPHPQPIEMETV